MINQKFGRWTVLNYTGQPRRVQCRCECGTERSVFAGSLTTGYSTSCGCARNEANTARGTHLQSKTPEYRAWAEMKKRCLNPKSKSFCNYGGRGISVCREWLHDFAAFAAHVGPKPSPGHTLGRIDNERGYEPGNVHWETAVEQANNKRTIRYLTINGETIRASLLAERNGIKANAYKMRIHMGWTPERAATEPMKWRK